MKINETITNKVITKSKLPDADFVINPFVGCQHACIYCYADFMKRFTGHSGEKWGEFVDVKINAAETIKGYTHPDKTLLIGSVTDPYQQVEKKHEITRQILVELLKYQPRIEILTKSGLIIRDIEILKKFKNLRVGISLNSLDPKISRELEPFASTPSIRIRVLKELNAANIKSYLFISPIFPYITNYQDIIKNVMDFTQDISFENLNIRANNKVEICKFIEKNKPELLDFYRTLSTNKIFWKSLKSKIISYCTQNNINYKIYFDHLNEKTN
ncbi:MAG: radical SAM protein [Bacteroidota bacterium]